LSGPTALRTVLSDSGTHRLGSSVVAAGLVCSHSQPTKDATCLGVMSVSLVREEKWLSAYLSSSPWYSERVSSRKPRRPVPW
jgi:hypothetical protein